ncbi:MAG: isoprenylcysteine carboxylmethyltransferase family protein [Candidatus Sungbacteria bacterium]|uniref:Isoprenylcysteine carboxylmethyltransferase family protein n=1 Tax=Candidatus Sungiibacteriota bacterium TaxID=2750080 RepID=A0A932YWE1_9BACT|nr:isoprenylcysteine carboxylmethyltransferase family protein [Candidatus Sungbacteria bacterium]
MPETSAAKPIAKPPYLYGGFLAAGIILHFMMPLAIFARFWVGLATGLPLMLAGALLIILAVRTLLAAHVDPRFRPVETIVSGGPYGYSRNPMYLAFTLIYAGIALAVNSFWPLVLLPFLLGLMYYGVIRREERYLEERFGEKYRDYRRRVRRWI